MPWVIVGALAPRRHIYAHEFAWDRQRDLVWKRLQKIHAWYGSGENLASVHGSGSVRGTSPSNSSSSICIVPRSDRAFWRKKPVAKMSRSSSSCGTAR